MGKEKLSKAQIRVIREAKPTLFGDMQLPHKTHGETMRVLLGGGYVQECYGGHHILTAKGLETRGNYDGLC